MIRTIFKITLEDDKSYYTTSRVDVVNKINDYHKEDETFKQYNINTINGVLYNNNKKVRGVKTNLRDQRNKVAEAARKRFAGHVKSCWQLIAARLWQQAAYRSRS